MTRDDETLLRSLLADRFLQWLNERYGTDFQFPADEAFPPDRPAVARDGARTLALTTVPLFPLDGDPWHEHRRRLQDQLAASLEGGYVLWLPPGADLPQDEVDAADFVRRVERDARALAPGQRRAVSFPVTLGLRQVEDGGAYMNVVGGLARHWARFTDQIWGVYQLDSSALHRIPEGDLDRLIREIVEMTKQIQKGQWAEIRTPEAWTVERTRRGEGFLIAGAPPGWEGNSGPTLRKAVRAAIRRADEQYRARMADVQALLLVGAYAYLEDELITVTYRGSDPLAYASIDLPAVAADGQIRAILEPPPERISPA
ncbi:MAG TPA: hypothetical protein VIO14_03390 [Dehalococcoidia bacterium]